MSDFSVTNAITGGVSTEKAIELRTAKEQKIYDQKAAKVTVTTQERAAMMEAQKLVMNMRETSNFSTILSNVFDNYGLKATTTDTGDASDYISVATNDNSYVGNNINIEVQQVAKGFSARIGADTALGFSDEPNLDGVLSMTINGQERLANIDDTMDINAVAQALRDAIKEEDNCIVKIDKQESISGMPTENFIVIESTVTGSDTNITLDTDNLIGSFKNPGEKIGKDAIIAYSSGGETILKTSKLNSNIDIAGFNVTAYSENRPGESQKIVVTPDHEMVEKTLTAFILSYNNLTNFIAKQQEKPTEEDQPATLRGSMTMHDLVALQNKIHTTVNNNEHIKSIFNLGLEVINIAEGSILDLKNQQKFTDAITNHYDEVREFFSNTAKITEDEANQGSTIRFVQIHKAISSNLYGKDIALSVTLDAEGKVDGVKAMLEGKEYIGKYSAFASGEAGNITFEDTNLNGLVLLFKPKNAVSNTENFTVNLSQGLAGAMFLTANSLYNEAQDGKLQLDMKSLISKLERLEKEASTAEEKLNRRTEFISQMIQIWTMREQMYKMIIDSWDKRFASVAA